MQRMKCTCKTETMLIDTIEHCNGCPKNGFKLDLETTKALKIDQKSWFYSEKTRVKASKLLDIEIERTEACENAECYLGTNWDGGCVLVICSACENIVIHIPFTDGC